MTTDDLLAALALPPETLLRQRIAKKLLLEEAPLPPAERRALGEAIEDLYLWATLKPEWCGVPAWQPTPSEAPAPAVVEVLVLGVRLRPAPATWPARLEALHRAFPYPLLLLAEAADAGATPGVVLSLAHKQPVRAEGGPLRLLEVRHTAPLHLEGALAGPVGAFVGALGLGAVPAPHLRALYQGYLDRAVALEAAHLTGRFGLLGPAGAAALRLGLARHAALSREATELRRAAARAGQVAYRVALNLRLRELTAELAAAVQELGSYF